MIKILKDSSQEMEIKDWLEKNIDPLFISEVERTMGDEVYGEFYHDDRTEAPEVGEVLTITIDNGLTIDGQLKTIDFKLTDIDEELFFKVEMI